MSFTYHVINLSFFTLQQLSVFDLSTFLSILLHIVSLIIIILCIFQMRYQEYPSAQMSHSTPQQFLDKFKTPHSIINYQSSEDPKLQIAIIQKILNISYNLKSDQNQNALLQLKNIVDDWLISINPHIPKKCGLYIFGSYKLEASSFDGDIDAVCVVPPYVNRQQHFFVKLVQMLEERVQNEQQKQQIFKIPMALVPLIKIRFKKVEFDILMCQISQQILTSDQNFLQGTNLIDIDQKQLKNLNGCRVANYLIKNITNYEYFKVTLKAIKMWAKNKGIYQQIFCYLGGIGYTILLAKICQLYPNYPPLKLLDRFFYIYSRWAWQIPVILEPSKQIEMNERSQMMIMTPINPSMNAAHAVCKSTLKIIKKQFRQASKLIQQIKQSRKQWKSLFTKSNFFRTQKYMLEISIMANKKIDFMMWKGHIQSKFRKLIRLLQNSQVSNLVEINPYPKQFVCTKSTYTFCNKYYIGIKSKSYNMEDDIKQLDFTQSIRSFFEYLQNYNQIELFPDLINIGAAIVTRNQIPEEIIKGDNFYEYQ